MNKERLNKTIFILFIGLIILFSLIAFSISLKPITLGALSETIDEFYYSFYSSIYNQIILAIIAFLLFSLAIYLVQKMNKLNTLILSVTQKTSFGEVKISLNSINHLISKVLIKKDEIKDSRSIINIPKTGGINIDLHLVLKQDINIPGVSEEIQKELKDYLLRMSGIEVKEIRIHIDKVFYENSEVPINKKT